MRECYGHQALVALMRLWPGAVLSLALACTFPDGGNVRHDRQPLVALRLHPSGAPGSSTVMALWMTTSRRWSCPMERVRSISVEVPSRRSGTVRWGG